MILVTVSMLVFSATQAYATGYTAMIAQGNTTDVGDCAAIYEGLTQVPSPHTYTIYNRGWAYNGGNPYALTQRAGAGDLVEAITFSIGAGTVDVIRSNSTSRAA